MQNSGQLRLRRQRRQPLTVTDPRRPTTTASGTKWSPPRAPTACASTSTAAGGRHQRRHDRRELHGLLARRRRHLLERRPSNYFAGSIDEVAVYPGAQPAHGARALLAGRRRARQRAPTAAFITTATVLLGRLRRSHLDRPRRHDRRYAWNFGDSTTGERRDADHTLRRGRHLPVTLTVTDDSRAPTTATTGSVTVVANRRRRAAFTAICTGSGVPFDATASSATRDGTIASYAWDFGDGATGTGVTATHTYAGAGHATR